MRERIQFSVKFPEFTVKENAHSQWHWMARKKMYGNTTNSRDLLIRLMEFRLLQVEYLRAVAFQCSKRIGLEISALYGLNHGMEHLHRCRRTRRCLSHAHFSPLAPKNSNLCEEFWEIFVVVYYSYCEYM